MKHKLSMNDVKHVLVGGIKTACLSREELTDLMIEDCRSRRERSFDPALIFDSNGHGISMAASDREFNYNLQQADIIHADGGIIVTAANKMTDGNIGDRSATTDYFHDAAKAASINNLTFYLLGATEETNQKCYDILVKQYPDLKIIGRRNGFFTVDQEDDICAEISKLKPDIVWVGLGKPKEQDFCVRNKSKIDAGWLITCGGCYNYITGEYPRAPLWMQTANIEWLHRMITKPRQLFWRYLTTNPHALFLLATRTKKELLD